MYLEERYSKMTDIEVMERYKDFDSCFSEAQLIILKELEKRKLISEEKIKLHYQEINEKREKEKSGKLAKEKKVMSKRKSVILFLVILFVIKVILPLILFFMGNSAYRDDEYSKAEKLYRASAHLNKGYTPSTVMLGTVLVIEKKYKEAIAPLSYAKNVYEKRGEEDDWSLRGLAISYLNLGDYKKFEELYPRVVKATKDNELEAYFYRSIAHYYWNKDTKKALEFINKAISLYKEEADFYFLRGDINRQLKKYDDAIKDFLTEIEKQKKVRDDVYYRLAGCYKEGKNDLKNSLKYFDLYIDNYNEVPEIIRMPMYYIYYQKAELLRDMGDFKGAKEYAERVLNYDKNEVKTQKYYDESILEAKKILKSIEGKK